MVRTWALVGAITVTALGLRVYGVWYGWPYVFHPDEPHVVGTAVRFLDPATPDLNPHFFQYPALFIYLTAALYAALGWLGALAGYVPSTAALPELYREQPALFHVAARGLSALAGAATVPLVFLIGRRLFTPAAGVLAAALLAVNVLHLRESHYASTDATVTFFSVAAVYAAVRVWQTGTLRWYLLAGILSGLAAATKYPAGIVLLTVLLAHVLRARSTPAAALLSSRPLIAAVAAFDAFFTAAPYTLLDPQAFANALFNEWVAQSIPQSGELTDTPLYYLRALTLAPAVPLVGLGVSLASIAYLAARRNAAALLLLSFPLLYYTTIGVAVIKVERYFMPVLPFVAIAVAVLLVRLVSIRILPVRLATAAVGLLVLGSAFVSGVRYDAALAAPDTRVQAKEWMERRLPRGAKVALIEGSFSWQNPPRLADQFSLAPLTPPYQDVLEYRREKEQQVLSGPIGPVFRLVMGEYSVASKPVPRGERFRRGVETWTPPDLDGLRRRGVDYVVLTDQFRAWYLADGTARHFPKAWRIWNNFFRELERAPVIGRFDPKEPGAGGFALGSGITIYSVRDANTFVALQSD